MFATRSRHVCTSRPTLGRDHGTPLPPWGLVRRPVGPCVLGAGSCVCGAKMGFVVGRSTGRTGPGSGRSSHALSELQSCSLIEHQE